MNGHSSGAQMMCVPHNDNIYNLTDGGHGWPCFANSAIADFFLSLP